MTYLNYQLNFNNYGHVIILRFTFFSVFDFIKLYIYIYIYIFPQNLFTIFFLIYKIQKTKKSENNRIFIILNFVTKLNTFLIPLK